MTKQKSFKDRIRARMDKTGESYASARRHLVAKAEAEARRRRTPRTISPTRTSDESLRDAAGRSRDDWFSLLDAWGARERKHPEIARWLREEHGVDGWWAQHVTVAYEQERGMRAPGQRSDGTYSVGASKTVMVPVTELFAAFEDEHVRRRWLGDAELEVRTVRPPKTFTAAWGDGTTRVTVGFTSKGDGKSQVALAHEKVAAAARADELKAFWRERLTVLKETLES